MKFCTLTKAAIVSELRCFFTSAWNTENLQMWDTSATSSDQIQYSNPNALNLTEASTAPLNVVASPRCFSYYMGLTRVWQSYLHFTGLGISSLRGCNYLFWNDQPNYDITSLTSEWKLLQSLSSEPSMNSWRFLQYSSTKLRGGFRLTSSDHDVSISNEFLSNFCRSGNESTFYKPVRQ